MPQEKHSNYIDAVVQAAKGDQDSLRHVSCIGSGHWSIGKRLFGNDPQAFGLFIEQEVDPAIHQAALQQASLSHGEFHRMVRVPRQLTRWSLL